MSEGAHTLVRQIIRDKPHIGYEDKLLIFDGALSPRGEARGDGEQDAT